MSSAIDPKIYDDVKASTNVINGFEYKSMFCAVAKVVSDIVAETLGPYGSTTIIDDGTGFTYPTKDGWSCMSRLRFNDPVYNTIFGIIKQVSFNSVSTVGDGTTTAMVATNYFLQNLYEWLLPKAERYGYRQADILQAMERVSKTLTERLRKSPDVRRIDPDGDMSDIYKIAYIATNGNEVFSKMLQDIYLKTKNPNIRIEIDSGAAETTYDIEAGYRFDCGVIGFENYVNSENATIHYDSPAKVIVFDHNVTFAMHRDIITAISKIANLMNTEIIIMAPYFDDLINGAIQQQVAQMQRQGIQPNIMLVQIPTVSKIHQQAIVDLVTITGGMLASDSRVKAFNVMFRNATAQTEEQKVDDDILHTPEFDKYTSPQALLEDCLGIANKAIFTKTNGYIMNYESVANKAKLEAMLREAKQTYEEASIKAAKVINGFLDKDYLFIQNRYIRLMGNNAIIRVGGISDIQKRCDKDTLDDAILACRSAFQSGYTRGMDLAILKASEDLADELFETEEAKKNYNGDFTIIKDPTNRIDAMFTVAINKAFASVFETILDNRYGTDRSKYNADNPATYIVVNGPQGTSQFDNATRAANIITMCLEFGYCFNLRTEMFEEESDWTVINSVQTDIEIMSAMTNILTTLMTSNQFLSMNRSGDIQASHTKALDARIADERMITAAKTDAFIDTLSRARLVRSDEHCDTSHTHSISCIEKCVY